MIFEWSLQAPVLLVGLFVVFAPGIIALAGVGMRGLALLAAAPVFSVFATSAAAVLIGAVGVAWSPLSWAVSMLFLAAVSWGIGRLIGNRLPAQPQSGGRAILVSALVLGMVFTAWRLMAYIGDVEAISQTNDAVFHMNAVRFIIETASASSLDVTAVVGSAGFYPAAWHALVSMIVLITGTSLPIAVNILTVIIGGVVWVLGLAWLVKAISGSAAIAGYAAVLAGVMQNFPLLMFQWGVLFPNALSTALIPASIAMVLTLPAWSHGPMLWRAVTRSVLVVGVVAGALALSQPASLLPWAAICMAWLSFRALPQPEARGRWTWWAGISVGWGLLLVVWWLLSRSTSGSHWPFFRDRIEALVDVVMNGQVLIAPQLGISALMIVGLIVAVRHRSYRWIAVAWLGISSLYWLVATVGNERIRDMILGAWYADPYRIAALAPIVVIPLGALGVDAIVRFVSRGGDRANRTASRSIALGILAVFVLLVVMIRPVPLPSIVAGTYEKISRYEASANGYLTPDERHLLESLGDLVESDARVLGNPSTGSGFGYFFSGIDVFPRNWAPPSDDVWQTIAEGLRDVDDDPEVCRALADYGDPEYVLDFGPGGQSAGRWLMPGLTDFGGQPGFELVAEEGDVSLWRITACAR